MFVIDTSVFLSDPKALDKLSGEDIIIPMAVLLELEAKRNHPELGYSARTVLRKLEEYRREYEDITQPILTSNGGSLRIEMNSDTEDILPGQIWSSDMDSRILSVAYSQKAGLITKDLPLRLRAATVGIEVKDFGDESSGFKDQGLRTHQMSSDDIECLFQTGRAHNTTGIPRNAGAIVKCGTSSALVVNKKDELHLIRDHDYKGMGYTPRNAEQKVALNFLMEPSIPLVSLHGRAGSGKSLLAITSGVEQVLESRQYRKVVVFRPLYAVGGQDLGFLPGTAEEKMDPWTAAVYDILEDVYSANIIDDLVYHKKIEVLPLTHIRGRTFNDSFIIIDEAQQLEKMTLLTALTRLGNNSKGVLTYDINQRDNLRVGKYDGVASVVSKLEGSPLFAHLTLTKSERSEIAELVSELVES